jgi:hypothetical protein
VTPALEKGLLKGKPEADVVGKGLEHIEEAMEKINRGVSAKKLVVKLL